MQTSGVLSTQLYRRGWSLFWGGKSRTKHFPWFPFTGTVIEIKALRKHVGHILLDFSFHWHLLNHKVYPKSFSLHSTSNTLTNQKMVWVHICLNFNTGLKFSRGAIKDKTIYSFKIYTLLPLFWNSMTRLKNSPKQVKNTIKSGKKEKDL